MGGAKRVVGAVTWVWLCWYSVAAVTAETETATALQQSRMLMQQGHYEQDADELIVAFRQAVSNKHSDPALLIELGHAVSRTYQYMGQPLEGLAALEVTRRSLDKREIEIGTSALMSLSNREASLLIDVGAYDEARARLNSASSMIGADRDIEQQVLLQNSFARLETAEGNAEVAYRYLRQARDTALQEPVSQSARSLTMYNYAKTVVDNARLADMEQALLHARQTAEALPSSVFKVQQLLNVALLYSEVQERYGLSQILRLESFRLLQHASRISIPGSMHGPASHALGNIGLLYEAEGRHEEALAYARQAVFHAQQAQDARSLYQWEWLSARCFWALQRMEESGAAFQRAIVSLEGISTRVLLSDPEFFQQSVGPLYYQYADLTLRMARESESEQIRIELLFGARALLESLKRSEVEDYFRSECVAGLEDSTLVESADPHTAVIYPIILEERLEVLVFIGDQVMQHASPVRRVDMTQLVRDFRLQLEVDTGSRKYLELGEELYQYLIAPFEKMLRANGIATIVMVPDGPLRTIPLAALYDGRHYLVESYALAASLGLSLTVQSHQPDRLRLFAGGVTESVQGFDALPYAARELESLSGQFNARVYQDSDFTLATVSRELVEGGFSVAHFATHGEFAGNIEDSFLLTHDGKLKMEQLESSVGSGALSGQPLDLLVLSACQTAAGDDRAALGLAGVAVQAGAASALATLWSINDEATYELINAFYDRLQSGKVSKASSLQHAQIKLIKSANYKHPSHWSPFLLIGSWI